MSKMNKTQKVEFATKVGMHMADAIRGANAWAEDVATMRADGWTEKDIGDKRVCPVAAAIYKAALVRGLTGGSINNGLSAMRFALAHPTVAWDSNRSRMAKQLEDTNATDDGDADTGEGAAKGGKARVPMSFAERLRRLRNDDGFTAFSEFVTEYARKHPRQFDLAKMVDDYVAANTPNS